VKLSLKDIPIDADMAFGSVMVYDTDSFADAVESMMVGDGSSDASSDGRGDVFGAARVVQSGIARALFGGPGPFNASHPAVRSVREQARALGPASVALHVAAAALAVAPVRDQPAGWTSWLLHTLRIDPLYFPAAAANASAAAPALSLTMCLPAADSTLFAHTLLARDLDLLQSGVEPQVYPGGFASREDFASDVRRRIRSPDAFRDPALCARTAAGAGAEDFSDPAVRRAALGVGLTLWLPSRLPSPPGVVPLCTWQEVEVARLWMYAHTSLSAFRISVALPLLARTNTSRLHLQTLLFNATAAAAGVGCSPLSQPPDPVVPRCQAEGKAAAMLRGLGPVLGAAVAVPLCMPLGLLRRAFESTVDSGANETTAGYGPWSRILGLSVPVAEGAPTRKALHPRVAALRGVDAGLSIDMFAGILDDAFGAVERSASFDFLPPASLPEPLDLQAPVASAPKPWPRGFGTMMVNLLSKQASVKRWESIGIDSSSSSQSTAPAYSACQAVKPTDLAAAYGCSNCSLTAYGSIRVDIAALRTIKFNESSSPFSGSDDGVLLSPTMVFLEPGSFNGTDGRVLVRPSMALRVCLAKVLSSKETVIPAFDSGGTYTVELRLMAVNLSPADEIADPMVQMRTFLDVLLQGATRSTSESNLNPAISFGASLDIGGTMKAVFAGISGEMLILDHTDALAFLRKYSLIFTRNKHPAAASVPVYPGTSALMQGFSGLYIGGKLYGDGGSGVWSRIDRETGENTAAGNRSKLVEAFRMSAFLPIDSELPAVVSGGLGRLIGGVWDPSSSGYGSFPSSESNAPILPRNLTEPLLTAFKTYVHETFGPSSRAVVSLPLLSTCGGTAPALVGNASDVLGPTFASAGLTFAVTEALCQALSKPSLRLRIERSITIPTFALNVPNGNIGDLISSVYVSGLARDGSPAPATLLVSASNDASIGTKILAVYSELSIPNSVGRTGKMGVLQERQRAALTCALLRAESSIVFLEGNHRGFGFRLPIRMNDAAEDGSTVKHSLCSSALEVFPLRPVTAAIQANTGSTTRSAMAADGKPVASSLTLKSSIDGALVSSFVFMPTETSQPYLGIILINQSPGRLTINSMEGFHVDALLQFSAPVGSSPRLLRLSPQIRNGSANNNSFGYSPVTPVVLQRPPLSVVWNGINSASKLIDARVAPLVVSPLQNGESVHGGCSLTATKSGALLCVSNDTLSWTSIASSRTSGIDVYNGAALHMDVSDLAEFANVGTENLFAAIAGEYAAFIAVPLEVDFTQDATSQPEERQKALSILFSLLSGKTSLLGEIVPSAVLVQCTSQASSNASLPVSPLRLMHHRGLFGVALEGLPHVFARLGDGITLDNSMPEESCSNLMYIVGEASDPQLRRSLRRLERKQQMRRFIQKIRRRHTKAKQSKTTNGRRNLQNKIGTLSPDTVQKDLDFITQRGGLKSMKFSFGFPAASIVFIIFIILVDVVALVSCVCFCLSICGQSRRDTNPFKRIDGSHVQDILAKSNASTMYRHAKSSHSPTGSARRDRSRDAIRQRDKDREANPNRVDLPGTMLSSKRPHS
jgi:hypothetical protein